MAEFSKLVITNKGQALLAKMIAGSGNIEFTQISASSTAYTTDAQLEELTSLADVKQTSLISKITRTNEVAIEVEAAFTNTELTEGYHMKALGLYAVDPDDGEILYAVTRETSGNCYMPAYNGITVSGAYVQLVTTVGNAENVSLEVNQAAVATIGDIRDLQGRVTAAEQNIKDLQSLAEKEGSEVYNLDATQRTTLSLTLKDNSFITNKTRHITLVISVTNNGGTEKKNPTLLTLNSPYTIGTPTAVYIDDIIITGTQGGDYFAIKLDWQYYTPKLLFTGTNKRIVKILNRYDVVIWEEN